MAKAQVTKFCNSAQKQFLYPDEPMEVRLAENSFVISQNIIYLPLTFADSA